MTTPASTGTILDRIVAARRASYLHRQRVLPLVALKIAVQKNERPRDFAGALAVKGLRVIAELKKASPSRGLLRQDLEPETLAPALEQAGAAALSVLTEEEFFLGSVADLCKARAKVALPVLRKDFILDPWQVWETRAAGADSFLLIVAVLSDAMLCELIALGRELGMEPLVEVHTREELRRALDAGARIIGVNNRDLKSFEMRLEASFELIEEIPEESIAVSESGIRSTDDIARLRKAGFDAFLVGERLMQAAEPERALRELLGAVDSK